MADRAEMDEFVARVRAGSDIVAVVSGYVPLKRKGDRYWGCCPFHQEKTPSFSVLPDKGFFYCFGCHAGGNVFKFLSLIEGITYFEAIKLQAEKLNIPLLQSRKSPEEVQREQKIDALRRVNEMARDFFYSCLTKTGHGAKGRAYLKGRGITDATIEHFKLGFAPEAWDKLTVAFTQRGIEQDLLIESGLAVKSKKNERLYDRFRSRVMIPIADERGHVVGFGGRVTEDATPKYLNSPETILFNKRRLLFGLDRAHRAIQRLGYAVVVEGYMDAIALSEAGVENVVATLGTAFTLEHAKLILRYAKDIYFCYDSDEAGQQATIRALSLVTTTGARVKVITLPEGKDPDEYIKKHGRASFEPLIAGALPLVEYRLRYVLSHNSYDTMEGKNLALEGMLPVLKNLSPGELGEYKKKLSQTLMMDEGVIQDSVLRYRPAMAPVATSAVTTRQRARKADSALQQAGRAVIRTLWQDKALAPHVREILPPEAIVDEVQREILAFLFRQYEQGKPTTDMTAATALTDAAATELSEALAESYDGQDSARTYEDSLYALKRAHLNRLFMEQSQEAERLEKAGDAVGAVKALQAANRLRQEMDDR
ncbi:MAG: DNA primase [Selenomonadaceae bacterium]|nr:DNA primase [Selenomonadaceae bacterium]